MVISSLSRIDNQQLLSIMNDIFDNMNNCNYNENASYNIIGKAFMAGYYAQVGCTLNLDNGIPQTQVTDTPCTGGEADMAKRQKFHIELPNGEKVWLTGSTISDAFANGLAKYGNNSTPQETNVPTVEEFVSQTYRPSFISGLAPTTVVNYEQYLNLNILPFLGKMKMCDVTVATVQSFYNWMATASQRGRKSDLDEKSIERISGLASRIFRVAMEMKLITDTPFKKTLLRNPGAPAGHHQALSDLDFDRIKMAIPLLQDERQRLYMGLLVYAGGARKEELCGLRWEHLHFEGGYGEMKMTVTYPKNGKPIIRHCGKTRKSLRTFIIPPPLKDILLPLAKESGFICHGRNPDEPMSHKTMQRTYTEAFKLLGIKGKYNNHDFRATFGTQLKENGVSSAIVADLMGHSDTRMVETVYARTRHEGIMKQRSIIEALNRPCAEQASERQ